MDIASLIGMVGAVGMIAGSMVTSGGIGPYLHTASTLIVVGGTFFGVMYSTPLPRFLGSFGVMAKAFLPSVKKQEDMIERMVDLAGIARKDGMMALEARKFQTFFEKGLQLLVDSADEGKLTVQLSQEIKAMKTRHEDNQAVIKAWVDLAPAMGMIGTLIGLVAMLGNMADPKASTSARPSSDNPLWRLPRQHPVPANVQQVGRLYCLCCISRDGRRRIAPNRTRRVTTQYSGQDVGQPATKGAGKDDGSDLIDFKLRRASRR